MEKASCLGKNIYLKVGEDQVLPLIHAGNTLPAIWCGPFTRALSNRGAIDVQLLFGSSLVASENTSIGRWRISGIPEDESVRGELVVKVTVSKSGNVHLAANLHELRLNVALLPGVLRSAPIEQRMDTEISKVSDDGILECGNCKRPLGEQFVGKTWDKPAVCPYCGSGIDLPDNFGREQRNRKRDLQDLGTRVAETTAVETRFDPSPDGHNPTRSMTLDDVEKFILMGNGNILDDDLVQGILGRSLEGELPTNSSRFNLRREEGAYAEGLERDLNTNGQLGCLIGMLQMFGIGRQELKVTYAKSPLRGDSPFKRGSLELEDLIRQKGPPPPPEELVLCPSCNAKIFKDEIRCPWCSETLTLPDLTIADENQNER